MRTVALFAVAFSLTPVRGLAQDDYRHADEGRPIRIEDAYPIKFGEWEWELGATGMIADGGSSSSASLAELKYGFARNLQLGVEVHAQRARNQGVTQSGVEGLAAHVLYNLNQEGNSAPALGIRGDLTTPGVGDLRTEDWSGRLKAILTKSFGHFRAHVNGAYSWASAIDDGDFWSVGLALDRPLGLSSKLLLGDVYLEIPTGADETRVWADVGARMQVTKTMVLDFGVTSRLDQWTDGMPNVGIVIGLSRTFGFAGLIDVPAYPNPRIN